MRFVMFDVLYVLISICFESIPRDLQLIRSCDRYELCIG